MFSGESTGSVPVELMVVDVAALISYHRNLL